MRMDLLREPSPLPCAAGVPDGLVGDGLYRRDPRCWERATASASTDHASTRSSSSSFGESSTSRSLPPLPWRIWMTMRWLSMSSTLIRAASVLRTPVA